MCRRAELMFFSKIRTTLDFIRLIQSNLLLGHIAFTWQSRKVPLLDSEIGQIRLTPNTVSSHNDKHFKKKLFEHIKNFKFRLNPQLLVSNKL